jgi:hypothetical protein
MMRSLIFIGELSAGCIDIAPTALTNVYNNAFLLEEFAEKLELCFRSSLKQPIARRIVFDDVDFTRNTFRKLR